MLTILKDKTVYNKIILSVVPFTALCSTALSALIAGVTVIFAVSLSWVAVSALKQFLTSKTAAFVRIVIAVGVVGITTMFFSIMFKDVIESISVYLPLISITTAVLVGSDDILSENPLNVLLFGAVISSAAAAFLFAVGLLKEFLGMGSIFGLDIYTKIFSPMEFFKTPAGALLICAVLTVFYNAIVKLSEKRGAK